MTPPRLSAPLFTLPFKVRDYEVDSEGIVNNANYLHYMEHTRHEFCEAAGLSFAQMRQAGMGPVVRRIEVEYVRSLGLGDAFISNLTLSRKGPRFIFHQWITSTEGQLIVEARIEVVNVINGRPTRGDELACLLPN